MRRLTPLAKTILVVLLYAIMFLLPLQLAKVLQDYTFNLAISQLTLSLFIISYDYDLFAKEFKEFSLHTMLGFLFFIATCVVFTIFILLSTFTQIKFSDLFVPLTITNVLLQIMELFSIIVCMHINEAYLYVKLSKLYKEDNGARAIVVALVLYFVIHTLLSYFSGASIISSLIYYALTGILLAGIHHEHESMHIYFIGSSLTILAYMLLF